MPGQEVGNGGAERDVILEERRSRIDNNPGSLFDEQLNAADFQIAPSLGLAMTLADLRNTQDCVLMGRRDCAHISAQKADLIRHN